MFIFNEKDVYDLAYKTLNRKVKLKPIGNHHLKRHYVYLVTDDMDCSYVLKIYLVKNRRNREIASLKLLENSSIKCPKIIDYGFLKFDIEWMLIEYIDGITFDKLIHNMHLNNKIKVFSQMGKQLGELHSYKKFDFFGNWNEKRESIDSFKKFKTAFISRADVTIKNLLSKDLPNKSLHKKAVDTLINMFDILDNVTESRLCHNDFDSRNILIKKQDNLWELASIIDFEQCLPWDKDYDLAILYHKHFIENDKYKQAFFKEYTNYFNQVDENDDKIRFYLNFIGICICSWAYKNAYDYYNDGIKLLERVL